MSYHIKKLVAGLALSLTASVLSPSVLAAALSKAEVDPTDTTSDPSVVTDDTITPGLVPYMKLRTFGEERLSWLSGGNHPNHKWVEITVEPDGRRLVVHEDNTYGTVRMDYSLDVDSGTIEVTMVRSPGISQTETLTLPVYDSGVIDRLSYTGALHHMVEIIAKIAEGNDLGYVVIPPRPELSETEAFLKELMRRCMI